MFELLKVETDWLIRYCPMLHPFFHVIGLSPFVFTRFSASREGKLLFGRPTRILCVPARMINFPTFPLVLGFPCYYRINRLMESAGGVPYRRPDSSNHRPSARVGFWVHSASSG